MPQQNRKLEMNTLNIFYLLPYISLNLLFYLFPFSLYSQTDVTESTQNNLTSHYPDSSHPEYSLPLFKCNDLEDNHKKKKEKIFNHLKLFGEKNNINLLNDISFDSLTSDDQFNLIYLKMSKLIYNSTFSRYLPGIDSLYVYNENFPYPDQIRFRERKQPVQYWQDQILDAILEQNIRLNIYFLPFMNHPDLPQLNPHRMNSMKNWQSAGVFPIEITNENQYLSHMTLDGILDPSSMLIHDFVHALNSVQFTRFSKGENIRLTKDQCNKLRNCFEFMTKKNQENSNLTSYQLFFILHETILDDGRGYRYNGDLIDSMKKTDLFFQFIDDFSFDILIPSFLDKNINLSERLCSLKIYNAIKNQVFTDKSGHIFLRKLCQYVNEKKISSPTSALNPSLPTLSDLEYIKATLNEFEDSINEFQSKIMNGLQEKVQKIINESNDCRDIFGGKNISQNSFEDLFEIINKTKGNSSSGDMCI
jgi:hypothetical protein